MAKRFTETNKWNDAWYRRLPCAAKLLWLWLCDNCDHAGVISPDLDLASFQIGEPVDESTVELLGDRLGRLKNGKLHIRKFVIFQYGKLSALCKPHVPVFAALEKHGLDPNGIDQNENYKNHVEDNVRKKVFERDGMVCAYFGTEIDESEAVIDHIYPRSKGGRATMNNLVVASNRANMLKRDMHVHRFCIAHSLDFDAVLERLSKATGRPIEDFLDNSVAYQGRFKEQDKEKDKEEDKTEKPAAPALPFPSPEFAAAWASWAKHRAEIKKKLTPTSTTQQLQKLQEMGESRAIAAIQHSVASGYQGIFEPKGAALSAESEIGPGEALARKMGLK